jgi:hypothetical protein
MIDSNTVNRSQIQVIESPLKLCGVRIEVFPVSEGTKQPYSKDGKLYLPQDYRLGFYQLGGDKFIFEFERRKYVESGVYMGSWNWTSKTYWFGEDFVGSIGSFSLTEINSDSFEAYERGGKKAFFASLKPEIISKLEDILGVDAFQFFDIFKIDLGSGSEGLRKLSKLVGHKFSRRKIVKEHKIGSNVFRTKKRISGTVFEVEIRFSGVYQQIMLAEGELILTSNSRVELKTLHLLTPIKFQPNNNREV